MHHKFKVVATIWQYGKETLPKRGLIVIIWFSLTEKDTRNSEVAVMLLWVKLQYKTSLASRQND